MCLNLITPIDSSACATFIAGTAHEGLAEKYAGVCIDFTLSPTGDSHTHNIHTHLSNFLQAVTVIRAGQTFSRYSTPPLSHPLFIDIFFSFYLITVFST